MGETRLFASFGDSKAASEQKYDPPRKVVKGRFPVQKRKIRRWGIMRGRIERNLPKEVIVVGKKVCDGGYGGDREFSALTTIFGA